MANVITLISPTTTVQGSQPQLVNDSVSNGWQAKVHVGDTIFATGLAGAEVVSVKIVAPDGSTANLVIDAVPVQLSVDNTMFTFRGCLTISVVKAGTAGNVGVWLQRAGPE